MFDENHIDSSLPTARPVLTWPGGKRRLLKHILPLVPDHLRYVEPFGGGLAVFLGKPRSHVEVINDINSELISFYRCCRRHLDALLDELDMVMHSRQEIDDYRQQPGLTEIERCARWFLINVLSFGGTMTSFRVQRTHGQPSRHQRLLAIRSLSARLDNTAIEHLSWERCVDTYDGPDAFFFFDPPYLSAGGSAYAGWSEVQLQAFCTRLETMEAKWMVTFQDCAQIRDMLAGRKLVAIERANGIGNNGKQRRGRIYREVIITNEPAKTGTKRKRRSA